ncbi:DoxX family protein [Agromyces intestinalis]|uniref:DoxX family protein n=1 Tax=Agromyces intestinalis TaxID=2592652 RepID=A0A5C1YIM0_9MICO|nr:DoxX family protein [Agromyces intestinalis]QEO15210.1 DoxX family protein [Agromyces intestinalis]
MTTTAPTARASAPRRNPWAQTFLSPVPIAFVGGIAGTSLAGAILAGFGTTVLTGWQAALTGGLVLMFLIGASGRLNPKLRRGLAAMVPPALPRPDLIVAATGVLEAAGAIGLLVPATHRIAAACLALLLIAVFPANVRAARLGDRLGSLASPLVPRTIEQIVFVASCVAVAIG